MEKIYTHLGKLALLKGWMNEDQLTECVGMIEANPQQKIEDILTKKYLTTEQLEYVQKKRKVNIRRIEGQALIDYLLKMKIINAEVIKDVTDAQQRAAEQKTFIPVSQILIARGVISNEKMEDILQQKEIQRVVRQAISDDDPSRTGMYGRVLGGYEIISEIASGGMGIVFNALQLELDRKVALKILFEQFASNAKHLSQFYREARLSGLLNHPNLVHIFEVGSDQGFHYYSMELVEGKNVGDRLKDENVFSQEEALDIVTQAAQGLEHIHSYDVVHRDIKPSNFMIRPDGIVKIMDLGLARPLNQIPKKAFNMGTPYYMAPELIHNPAEANHRADLYALGVSFYKMLTGEYPITGEDAKEILDNIQNQTPKPVRQIKSEISTELSNIIDKMIAKDVKNRYQNMGEVLSDLDRVLIIS